ncbi:MAG: hypothetical protein ACJ8F1_22655 [Polyangia bacterium]
MAARSGNKRAAPAWLVACLTCVVGGALPACGGNGGSGVGPISWPTLAPGDRYFETGGRLAPLFLRNVSAPSPGELSPLLADARAAGTTVVRLQLTQGFGYETLGITSAGGVLAPFATAWDAVISDAAARGLAVIPVFAIWGDWNDGTPALGWTHFDANPLNTTKGGPAAAPADLFVEGSETQRRWLGWLSALVARWSARPNILAWETFSELDLATGANQENATAFARHARDVVRAADPQARPVFASTSDLPLISRQPWRDFWASDATDIVSLHTYDADLDRAVVARATAALQITNKPVLLGESGLDAAAPDGTTITTSTGAAVGLESAIWAELFSGVATARALYWEDGYAVYYPASGLPLVRARKDLERRASAWLADKDLRGLAPLAISGAPALFGVALGGQDRVLGWARNDRLASPSWNAAPLDAANVAVTLPSGAANGSWTIELTLPDDGTSATVEGASRDGVLTFPVAMSFNRVAFAAARLP